MRDMTKEKFQTLCDQVLVPRIGALLHSQLLELHATLDIIAAELIRLEQRLDGIAEEVRSDG